MGVKWVFVLNQDSLLPNQKTERTVAEDTSDACGSRSGHLNMQTKVHWSLRVRSGFCPKKVDPTSGLTLHPSYKWFWLGPPTNWPCIRKDLKFVDLTSGLHCRFLWRSPISETLQYAPSIMSSHWQMFQVRWYFSWCTADSQADEDRNQQNKNMKIDKIETFASDYRVPMSQFRQM